MERNPICDIWTTMKRQMLICLSGVCMITHKENAHNVLGNLLNLQIVKELREPTREFNNEIKLFKR